MGLTLILIACCCLCCLVAGSSGAINKPFPENITHMSKYVLWWFSPQYVNRNGGESCPDGYENNNGLTGAAGCIKRNTF